MCRFFFPSPDRSQQNNNNNNSQNQTTTSATLNNNQLTSSTLPRAAHTRRQMQIEAQQATPIGHSTPPPVEQQQQNRTFHFDSPLSLMSRANTKKIGRKIKVQLTKGHFKLLLNDKERKEDIVFPNKYITCYQLNQTKT